MSIIHSKAPNTYSMVHKNWEKDDDQIEFVSLQTLQSLFFKSPWAKRSEGKRNWFEWVRAKMRLTYCLLLSLLHPLLDTWITSLNSLLFLSFVLPRLVVGQRKGVQTAASSWTFPTWAGQQTKRQRRLHMIRLQSTSDISYLYSRHHIALFQ